MFSDESYPWTCIVGLFCRILCDPRTKTILSFPPNLSMGSHVFVADPFCIRRISWIRIHKNRNLLQFPLLVFQIFSLSISEYLVLFCPSICIVPNWIVHCCGDIIDQLRIKRSYGVPSSKSNKIPGNETWEWDCW